MRKLYLTATAICLIATTLIADDKKERKKLCAQYKQCLKKCQKSYNPSCEALCEEQYPCEAEVEQKIIKES